MPQIAFTIKWSLLLVTSESDSVEFHLFPFKIKATMRQSFLPTLAVLLTFKYLFNGVDCGEGVDIGRIHSFLHGVKGYVTVLDEKTIEISGMTYDGEGPGSWFVAGSGDDYKKEFVDLDAIVIPDENNRCSQLRRYSGETIKLRFPGKVSDYDYLAIYCLKFHHNFGYIGFPSDMKISGNEVGNDKEVVACIDVDTSDAAQNREPTCQPWPSCWTKPSEEEDEDNSDEDDKN